MEESQNYKIKKGNSNKKVGKFYVEKKCLICGSYFIASRQQIQKSKCGEVFCSVPCSKKFLKQEKKDGNTRVSTKCEICKKDIEVKLYTFKRSVSKKFTCSRKCCYVLKKELCLKENNHQYGKYGEENSSFKSDYKITNYGYVALREVCHTNSRHDKLVLAHKLILEEHLRVADKQSPLLKYYEEGDILRLKEDVIIHHIDGVRHNNHLTNLLDTNISEHRIIHGRVSKEMKNKIKKGTQNKLKRAHIFDAGQDICSDEDITIFAKDSALIHTGLYIAIDKNNVGLIWSRSGLSVKHKLEVGAGCIDSNYRGEIIVHLYNHSDTNYNVKKGDKIAQLLTIPIDLSEYEEVEDLDVTDRGNGGFGSTDEKRN